MTCRHHSAGLQQRPQGLRVGPAPAVVGMSLETQRRLHLSISSTLEVKASPCCDTLRPGAAGFLDSHSTPWGHCCPESQRRHVPPSPFLPRCGGQPGKSIEVSLAMAERGHGSVLFVYVPCMHLGTTLRRIDRSCRKAE